MISMGNILNECWINQVLRLTVGHRQVIVETEERAVKAVPMSRYQRVTRDLSSVLWLHFLPISFV